MKPLFVVGTDTGIGKTVVSAAAVAALDARYWKPVQTGDDDDTRTVEELAGAGPGGAPRAIAPPLHQFDLPASPHTAAAAEDAAVDVAGLRRVLDEHVVAAAPAPLVVEFAGGLMVPLTDTYLQADWLEEARPDVLLVARSTLGTLNHTLLTREALERRGLAARALVLVGPRHDANRRTLEPHFVRVLELPTLDPLDAHTIRAWTDAAGLPSALDRPNR
ncbi:MAG: dethiobiotin synthase [Planctomycetota bacterium]